MHGGTVSQVDGILRVIGDSRFLWATELDLQRGLEQTLTAAGYEVESEVRLNPRDRIDLLVDRIGIEVKVDGPWRTVERQLRRYLESDQLDALVLVTAKGTHRQIRPADRLHVHQITRSGL